VVIRRTILTRWEVEAETAAEADALARAGRGTRVDADRPAEVTEVCEAWELAQAQSATPLSAAPA
jgi:hypothetical protein